MDLKSKKSLLIDKKKYCEMLDNKDLDVIGEPPECWLGVPLKVKDDCIGLLAVQSYTDSNAYTAEHKKYLEYVSLPLGSFINRFQLEENLKREKALLENLFRNSPEAIAHVDNDSRIINVNRSFEVIFGYKKDEMIGGGIIAI